MSKLPPDDQNASPGSEPGTPTSTGPAHADGCPRWAATLTDEIRALEVRLGNIRTTDPTSGAWQEAKLGELLARISDESHAFDESVVESHFRRICSRLLAEGFTAVQIAAFVNVRIPTGGRLAYCNADEVLEAAHAVPHQDD